MRAQLNRLLHGLASELVTRKHAHEYLHKLAVDGLKVKSWSDVTDVQAKMLADEMRKKIAEQQRIFFDAIHHGEDRISPQQIAYARALKDRLGWSNDYFLRLITTRYDERALETMPKWKAFRLIALLERRWNRKKARNQKSEVKP